MSGEPGPTVPANQQLITDAPALRALCDKITAIGEFAFDTEFVGEDSYEPMICLVQVATESFTALIDPMCGLDISPIWELLADPDIRVLVHAGGEDLAHCFRHAGRPPANVVDLQIAAGLLGWGYPISLSRLARTTIDAKLHKSQTLTDWRRRPLERDQIKYAREDVLYLPAIYRRIDALLTARGRRSWLTEECDAMCNPRNFEPKPAKKMRRLRGASSLSQTELAAVEALLGAREEIARKLNRPARAVLRDHILIEIARRGWQDPAKIRTLRGINLSNADLRTLTDAVAAARREPPPSPAEAVPDQQTPEEEVVTLLITAVLRDYCNHNELSYSLLATKHDINQTARHFSGNLNGNPLPSLLDGWRAEAVGGLLKRILNDKARLYVARESGRSNQSTNLRFVIED